ncbi:hypothetical protein LENED_001878 [Lentinula edodes]|uniref:Uncharacterized protein n=1 Tax=Lentinula edodes TaxID=5353 RepID=A0A1Q3DZE2_LENED|nr:hypothetical protein LENED_001878 [Lentinula edodes]
MSTPRLGWILQAPSQIMNLNYTSDPTPPRTNLCILCTIYSGYLHICQSWVKCGQSAQSINYHCHRVTMSGGSV